MDISVIVPFYNAEEYIEACIQGLLAQRYGAARYEVIMVDNNSTDASAEIVQRYPRVQLLSEERQGAYAARNRGLRAARGRVMAFTDPDCVPEACWLERLARTMQHSTRTGIVVGGYVPSADPLMALLDHYGHVRDAYIFSSSHRELYYGHTNNMAVRAELFEELGLFEERRRGSDAIFVRKAVDTYSCGAVTYCAAARVQHLEVERVATYYRKMFIYGYHRHMYRGQAEMRPLTSAERRLVFRRTVEEKGHSPWRATLLFGLLAGGSMSWTLGRWKARFDEKRASRVASPGREARRAQTTVSDGSCGREDPGRLGGNAPRRSPR